MQDEVKAALFQLAGEFTAKPTRCPGNEHLGLPFTHKSHHTCPAQAGELVCKGQA